MIVRYALLASAIVISIKLLVFFTHAQFSAPGIYSGLIALSLMIVPLVLAIKGLRDENGGYITLKEVMKAGMGISILSGAVISAFTFLYYKFIDHETLAHLITRTEAFMLKENKPQAEIDTQVAALKEFYSPLKQATGVLTGVLIAGLILTFISSTFLVKNPPAQEN